MSSCVSITGSSVSFEFPDGSLLFKKLNFTLESKIYGLVGPNGIGKTTFLRLLLQEVEPTEGALSVRGRVELLRQIPKIFEMVTVQEFLWRNEILEKWELTAKVEELFKSFGLQPMILSRLLSELSGGEMVRVQLAKMLLHSPSILLLDEPTNNLDHEGREALFEFIQSWKGSMLVVSHDRELLSFVGTTIEISKNGLQFFGGSYSFYVEQSRIERRALEEKLSAAEKNLKKQNYDLQRGFEKQQKRMHQGRKYAKSGGIPKVMAGNLKRRAQKTLARNQGVHNHRLDQARSELQAIQEKIRDENWIKIDLPGTVVPQLKILLELREVNFRFSRRDEYLFREAINFGVRGPERVLISGANGTGKSTLLRGIVKEIDAEVIGQIDIRTDRVAYLDQKMKILGLGNDTLLEGFAKHTPHLSESERRIRLGRFLLSREAMVREIDALSGGEKMRAALAFILFSERPPELLILDEPTNNLDLDSLEGFESALCQFQGALLLVSHDRHFIEKMRVTKEVQLFRSS